MRRLPIYLLIDCSESMIGPGVEAVQNALDTLVLQLRKNPQALETACLSVITFAGDARADVPLTDLVSFQPPRLAVRPGTALGAGLRLLRERIQQEVKVTTRERKGDWRPIVFLLTDGQPTDAWEAQAKDLRDMAGPRPANIYAIGCGPDVDFHALKQVADVVLRFEEMSTQDIQKMFVWMTASIQAASLSPDARGAKEVSGLDLLPPNALVGDALPPRPSHPRQVFLRLLCQVKSEPYLMRFGWDHDKGGYSARASHVLQGKASVSGSGLPKVDTSTLLGVAPCPYCNNPGASSCASCGTLFCNGPRHAAGSTCPGCKSFLDAFQEGSVEVDQSAG